MELGWGSDGFGIAFDASPAVRRALGQLGRTEDVAFSPNSRRLALAGFEHNAIAIVDIGIEMDSGPHVIVTNVTEFSSPRLKGPHGLEFVDDETIVVANRFGEVSVFRLPACAATEQPAELMPIDLPSGGAFDLLDAPGGLSIASREDSDIELLVCNNDGDTITRHVLHDDGSASHSVTANEILVRQRLRFPDGVAGSAAWVAVSNLHPRRVMMYERLSSLNESSDPDGILRGVSHPHGIRFSADGRALFVADSETPYVHVYLIDGDTWRGVQSHPTDSVPVVSDEAFERGRGLAPLHQGGPKGIGIDRRGLILAVTCECQPLAFFDVAAILDRSRALVDDPARQMSYELWIQEQDRLADARSEAYFEKRIARLTGSMSFRITKPLRTLSTTWSRFRA